MCDGSFFLNLWLHKHLKKKCTLLPAAEMSFKYSSSKKVFAFLMLVGTEWALLCESRLFPDFEMCIFISARVNMGIRARLDDQPSEGNFTEITDSCTVTSAMQLLHCCVLGTAALPFLPLGINLIPIWVCDVLVPSTSYVFFHLLFMKDKRRLIYYRDYLDVSGRKIMLNQFCLFRKTSK